MTSTAISMDPAPTTSGSTTITTKDESTATSVAEAKSTNPSHRHRNRQSKHSSLSRVNTNTLNDFLATRAEKGQVADTFWQRAIYAPVTFLAFLLSLSYVDWRDRDQRLRQRGGGSGWGWSGWWREPWQSRDGTWGVDGTRPETINGDRKDEYARTASWPIRKKLSKMARLELSDALDMRGTMVIVLMAGIIVAISCLWFVTQWTWARLSR